MDIVSALELNHILELKHTHLAFDIKSEGNGSIVSFLVCGQTIIWIICKVNAMDLLEYNLRTPIIMSETYYLI